MDWSQALFQVIDLRSFSSIWYWIVVAVVWSSVSHWVLGVPYDLIQRARRKGGEAEADFHDLVRINVNRLLHITGVAGMVLAGLVCFLLTSLAVLSVIYRVELAQAVLFLALPLTLVGMVSLSTARKIAATGPVGDALYTVLVRHRLYTQIIGMLAIFFTAMFGMYQNLGVVRGL